MLDIIATYYDCHGKVTNRERLYMDKAEFLRHLDALRGNDYGYVRVTLDIALPYGGAK